LSEINPVEGLKALSEATTDSLSELFNRNPLDMSEDDIRRIVEEFRKMRARWSIAELAGKKSLPKAAAPKAIAAPTGPAPPKDVEF